MAITDLSLSEGTVRYHLRQQARGAIGGRSRQIRRAGAFRSAIDYWFSQRADAPVNLAARHTWLVNEPATPDRCVQFSAL